MKSKLILAGATLALTSACAVAQTTAKPSPYEGVSQPPSTDVIHATEAPAAVPPAPAQAASAPAPAPVQQAPRTATPPAPAENPDYGIVETPVAIAPSAPTQSPNLQNRQDADADIVTNVPHSDNELMEGTAIHARMDRQISSREDGAGTRFTATVARDVMQNGRVIIPTGSVVHGKVVHADYGRRIAGPASLRLLADEIVLPDGTRYNMSAIPSQTSSDTKVNGEGTILSKDHPKKIAAEYAIGGGAGIITGAALGGPQGALIGAGVGAGVVTAHVLLNRQAAVLLAGSPITFGLKQPMRLTPITNTALNK